MSRQTGEKEKKKNFMRKTEDTTHRWYRSHCPVDIFNDKTH